DRGIDAADNEPANRDLHKLKHAWNSLASLGAGNAEGIADHGPGLRRRIPARDDDVGLVQSTIGHRLEIVEAVDAGDALQLAKITTQIFRRRIGLQFA